MKICNSERCGQVLGTASILCATALVAFAILQAAKVVNVPHSRPLMVTACAAIPLLAVAGILFCNEDQR